MRARGVTDCAVVFNFDPHTRKGSHWVAAFAHLVPDDPKYGVCYFDSAGGRPPAAIAAFMRGLRDQVAALDPPEVARHFRVKYNHRRKQRQDSECGMFCILFVVLCNESPGKTYLEVCEGIGDDAQAFAVRERVFIALPEAQHRSGGLAPPRDPPSQDPLGYGRKESIRKGGFPRWEEGELKQRNDYRRCSSAASASSDTFSSPATPCSAVTCRTSCSIQARWRRS